MLLPDNIHPEHTVYYNGAILLEAVRLNNQKGLIDLYQEAKLSTRMNFGMYILCLDWLFLLRAAELDQDGKVRLCS